MMGHVGRHHRRSIRLKGYNYTRDGAYFVTICTQGRVCLFGTVVSGDMQMNEYGREVADCWSWLAERYSYVHLDQWIVMPNHMHGIIVIAYDRRNGSGHDDIGLDVADSDGVCRGGSRTARTRTARTGFVGQPTVGIDGSRIASTKRKTLGRLIGAFKTVSTRRINDVRSSPGAKVWQRNYYERVVRNNLQLRRVRRYIASNPLRWELDRENQR
jgi:putative transposase